jgi:branched-subunit amino acid aminotransferase/4-amino-4-deoxychorismate lyase
MEEIIFLNGKFLPPDEAKVSVLAPGFLCGFGLFETMRFYQGKTVYLDAHLQRLIRSCRLIGLKLPYSQNKLKQIIRKTVSLSRFFDVYLRLTLYQGKESSEILILAKEYLAPDAQTYKQGFRAQAFSLRKDGFSFLAGIKTTSRLGYEIAFQQAVAAGFDEAVILNSRGYIAEASRSNIFWVQEGSLFTPDISCGCLAGVTRGAIFDLAKKYNFRIYTGNFVLSDLLQAQEAFLTNSLIGVMPLLCVEGKKIGKARCRKISEFFQEKYLCLLK